MKWHLINFAALVAVPVVPSLANYFGYIGDQDNQSAAALLTLLIAVAFVTRLMADRESAETSYSWLLMLIGFGIFFGYIAFDGSL